MLFVNRIAYILHDIVVQCSGSANKNIGDAFLLAWKLDDVMTDQDVTRLADQVIQSKVHPISMSSHTRKIFIQSC